MGECPIVSCGTGRGRGEQQRGGEGEKERRGEGEKGRRGEATGRCLFPSPPLPRHASGENASAPSAPSQYHAHRRLRSLPRRASSRRVE
ncbi:MAG: hypothetical protein EA370_12090 [Wenzhouxiangella sp.]|nr:MAG: hypothetical protein EA370_12090 [Wenzhouxiangella sp.]